MLHTLSVRVVCTTEFTVKKWILALILAPQLALAGGWTQPTGQAYAKLWYRGLIGQAAFDTGGEIVDLEDGFTDHAVNLYAEVGLVDWLTLVVHTNPFGAASFAGGDTTYVGRTNAGLRAGTAFGDTRLAIEAQYGFAPSTGAESIGENVVDGVPYFYAPTVETQSFSGELQAGHPLSFGWLAVSAGVRGFTADGLDPAIIGFGQLGWNVASNMTLDLHLNLHEVLGDVEVNNVAGAGQTRYLGWGLGYSWWFTDAVALAVGFEGVAYAQSNAATPSLIFGIESRGALWGK